MRSLVTYGQLETTLAKAKFIAPYVEHMITRARAGGLTATRYVMSLLVDPDLTKVFWEKVVPAMAGRTGGYTRITKLGPRVGDAAELVRLEWSVKVEMTEPKKVKQLLASKDTPEVVKKEVK